MSYTRWTIDLAVKEPITKQLETEMNDLKERLVHFQDQCEIINEGTPRAEDTKKMKQHRCRHDEGKRCEHMIDIISAKKGKEESIQYDTVGKLKALVWVPLKRLFVAGRK